MSLRHLVIQAHSKLILDADPSYREFWTATRDEDAVEGALWIDTMLAATLIREKTPELMLEKLQPIIDVLLVITDRDDRIEADLHARAEAEAKRDLSVRPAEEP